MSLTLGWLAIIWAFKAGILTGIIFLVEILVIDIFMIVITALIYLLILKFFDGEKVKNIINSGESVLFIPVAEIGYSEPDTLSNIIKVNLTIEEKQSKNILAKTELIIEDYSGTYKVKK